MIGYGGYGWMGGLGMGLGMVLWIVVVGLIIWAGISLLNRPTQRREDSALEILKLRYARGEISQAEFEQARQDLTR